MRRKYLLSAVRFLLKVLPVGFWLALIFAFDEPYVAFLTLIAVAVHEAGHIAALVHFSHGYSFFGVSSGLRLSSRKALSYREEIIVAASGPLINIALFIAASPLIILGGGEYARVFGLINLFTAISNLLLIEGYDGYRIAECLINRYSAGGIPYALLRASSFLLSALLALSALYLIRSFDGGYWIFFIFLFALLRAMANDRAVFPKKRQKNR